MKDFLKNDYRLFYAGILILLCAILLDYLNQTYFYNLSLKQQKKHIEKEINEDRVLCNSIFDHLEHENLKGIYEKFDDLSQLAQERNLFIYIFLNHEIILWTSNHIIPPLLASTDNHFVLTRLDNGYYLMMVRDAGFYQFVALKLVQNNYPFENKYLVNDFQLGGKNKLFSLKTTTSTSPKSYVIKESNGKTLLMLDANVQKSLKNWVLLFYFAGAFLIFIFIHLQINNLFRSKRNFHALTVFIAVIVFTVLGWKILRQPAILFQHDIFSPAVYASSRLLSSLGDLLISVFLLAWTIFLFTSNISIILPQPKIIKYIVFIAVIAVLLLMVHFISLVIKSLIVNSGIPCNMNEFLKFNFYSFVAFILIFLMLFSFIRLTRFFVFHFKKIQIPAPVQIVNLVIICLVYSIYYISHSNNYFLFNPLLLLSTWLLLYIFEKGDRKDMGIVFTMIIISAAFTTHQIIHASNIREIEKKKLLINTIVSGRDGLAEYLLNNIPQRIKNDNYLISFYTNPLISRYSLGKRLKQLYFSSYFSNYDFKLFTFSQKGSSFKSNDTIDISVLDSLYKGYIKLNDDGSLLFFNNFMSGPEYILKITILKDNSELGIVVIILKKKAFLEESAYPDLVVEKNINRLNELSNYSHAIYHNYHLITQKGDYFYPQNILIRNNKKSPFHVYKEGGYEHLCFHYRDDLMVILSNPVQNIFSSLALFSLLFFISSVLFVGLRFLFDIIVSYLRSNLQLSMIFNVLRSNISFKTKIQFVIMFSVFITICISGYLTIYNLVQQISKTNERKVSQEIRIIADRFNEYFRDDQSFGVDLDKFVKETSDQFRTDINVFNLDGRLISSSQMAVYDRSIVSKMMNPKAYYMLKIRKKTVFLHTETIGKKLNYTSAYINLYSENNQIQGFINVPYYSRFLSEKSELSSLIVNMVNLYVFILLLVLFVSVSISGTFTQPLEIISMHLRDLKLGRVNKKIQWTSEDEIGRLISEYNKMVENVEKSAEALSKSERESAWREMAQQVAHEIKNPLTPMKLSLQKLLISWHKKDPELEERFRKTTEILISQIDNLTQIATEFSEFARMPEPVLEDLNIHQCLTEVVDLYKAVERVSIQLDNCDKEISIRADYQQLKRVFNNLIKNAIQAIPVERKGEISIKVIKNASIVLISVSDNGTGITSELQDKIFLPNFSTKSSGMGLGLAIVSKIVKSFNGQIWFDTVENEGTTFYLSFPIVENVNNFSKEE